MSNCRHWDQNITFCAAQTSVAGSGPANLLAVFLHALCYFPGEAPIPVCCSACILHAAVGTGARQRYGCWCHNDAFHTGPCLLCELVFTLALVQLVYLATATLCCLSTHFLALGPFAPHSHIAIFSPVRFCLVSAVRFKCCREWQCALAFVMVLACLVETLRFIWPGKQLFLWR